MQRPNESEADHRKRMEVYTRLESERQRALVDSGRMEWFMMPGKRRLLVHTEKPDCTKFNCVIHNPSDHVMKDWPLNWRGDRGLMERICPHGIGHPDPDDLAFKARTRGEENVRYEGVHGCDGCCTGDYEKFNKVFPEATEATEGDMEESYRV